MFLLYPKNNSTATKQHVYCDETNPYIADAQVRQEVFKADPLEWMFCTGGYSVSESETEDDDACHCMAENAD